MKPPPLLGINGRLRQHITKVGAHHANRISSPKKAVTEDDYLRGLLHGSRITEEQLQKAIEGYNHAPSNFAWMQTVKDSVLDRADNVFLAKYGRDPTQDSDFRLNGDYYKICKNLKLNWHYYNADLETLRWDYQQASQGPPQSIPRIVEQSQQVWTKTPADSSISAFAIMMFVMVPLLIVGIKESITPLALISGAITLLLVIGLIQCRPKRVQEKKTVRTCSECGYEFKLLEPSWSSCPKCDVRFQEK